MLTKEGNHIDGSWILSVFIDTLGLERKIRVMSDWSITRVIKKTTEGLKPPQLILYNSFVEGEPQERSVVSFIEYNFWWPDKKKWLLHHGSSLSQYGIQADTWLRFTPTCGPVKIQLPDLQERIFPKVNFSDPIFRVVMSLCKSLGIRYPEELSLQQPSTNFDLKRSRYDDARESGRKKKYYRSQTIDHKSMTRSSQSPRPRSYYGSDYTLNDIENVKSDTTIDGIRKKSIPKFGPPKIRDSNSTITGSTYLNAVDSKASQNQVIYQETTYSFDQTLVSSPYKSTLDTLNKTNCPNLRPTDLIQKCRLFSNWLDSSKSLMEQGYENFQSIEANLTRKENCETVFARPQQPTLQLRFKYGISYDLNPKYDHIRINQLYNQAKWSVLMDQLDCSENEASLLAAIQLHVDTKSEQEKKFSDNNSSVYNIASISRTTTPRQRPISMMTNDETDNVYSSLRATSMQPSSPVLLSHKATHEAKDVETLKFMEDEIDKILDEIDRQCEIQSLDVGALRQSNSNRIRSPSGNKALVNDTFISSIRHGDLSSYEDTVPEQEKLPHLSSFVRMARDKKYNSKSCKRVFVVLRITNLCVYKDVDSCKRNEAPIETIDLRGCHIEYCQEFGENYCLKVYVPLVKTSYQRRSSFRSIDQDYDVVQKLKTRASFLSLTSLTNFINGGLNNAAAFIAGCVEKIMIQLNDQDQFIEWGAMMKLAGQLGPRTSMDSEILTMTNYKMEKESIKYYTKIFEPIRKSGRLNSQSLSRTGEARLLKRPIDYLPLRMSLQMNVSQTQSSTISQHSQHSRPPQSPRNITRSQTMDKSSKSTTSNRTNYENFVRLSCCKQPGRDELSTKVLNIYDEIASTDATSLGFKLKYITTWRNLQNHDVSSFLVLINSSAPLSIVTNDSSENSNNSTQSINNGNLLNKFNNIALKVRPFQSTSSNSFITLTMSRKEEILSISQKRLFRIDPQTGAVKASWKFSNIQGWHVNFELNEIVLYLAPVSEDKTSSGKIVITPTEVPVNIIAEYLGGYALLTLRAPFKRQELDEKKFYQLTSAGKRVSLAI